LGRHAVSTSNSFLAEPDRTRAVVLLAPRVRGDLLLTAALSTYLAAGADFSLNGFSFVSRGDGPDRVLLDPLLVRPALELGLTFRP
jgi:hypothetical protein